MSIRSICKIFVVITVGFLLGCATVPVYNVESRAIVSNKPVTAKDVEGAIVRAGAALGWQMVPKGPGSMEGTLVLRTHRAVVDVNYDAKNYSIKYKDSEDLKYDGTNIHKNYNGWIQNLEKGISTQLSLP
ncbi:MAG: hypothetical protein ACRET6_13030 [Burkholderiales bacterium]